jgi:hypothetical protein
MPLSRSPMLPRRSRGAAAGAYAAAGMLLYMDAGGARRPPSVPAEGGPCRNRFSRTTW